MTDDCFSRKIQLEKALTTVVGINCKDGIVIYSDTQETYPTLGYKRVVMMKTKPVGDQDRYMIGCAGVSADIELLFPFLDDVLKGSMFYDELHIKNVIKDHISKFLKEQNVEIPKETHGAPTEHPICIHALFGAQLRSNSETYGHALYKIQTNPRLIIREVPKFASIGSGRKVINPILDYLTQQLKASQYDWRDVSTILGARILDMIFDIVLQTDAATGGRKTRRILLDTEGVKSEEFEIWNANPISHTAQIIQRVCEELSKIKTNVFTNYFSESSR